MLKKIITTFLCAAMAFSAVVYLPESISLGYSVSAAQEYDTPYYYRQLSDEAQEVYDALREAVLECRKNVRVDVSINQQDFDKICELLILHDPITFNLKNIEAYEVTNSYAKFKITYRYKKETYDKMAAAYDEKAEKILSKLSDDMSVYKKIRTIHDEIIKTAVYDSESKTADTVYGTLVKRKAKCDGYAKTFTYICGKAGIRTVTVIGEDKTDESGNNLHMWNKVYYNKKWYNVDVTWDDPISILKNNKKYDFFMVSDDSMADSHKEDNLSLKVPKAEDNSKNYFEVNKKYLEDVSKTGSYIKKCITSAVDKNAGYIMFKCRNKSDYEFVTEYVTDTDKICNILEKVSENTDSRLISNIYLKVFNDNQYTVKICIFYDDTDLEDYFANVDTLDHEIADMLNKYGID